MTQHVFKMAISVMILGDTFSGVWYQLSTGPEQAIKETKDILNSIWPFAPIDAEVVS